MSSGGNIVNIVVQKFGGTSVSTEETRRQVIEKVKNAINEGLSPVVVVSAMGRKGQPYATDTLLSLIGDNFKKPIPHADSPLFALINIYDSTARTHF